MSFCGVVCGLIKPIFTAINGEMLGPSIGGVIERYCYREIVENRWKLNSDDLTPNVKQVFPPIYLGAVLMEFEGEYFNVLDRSEDIGSF